MVKKSIRPGANSKNEEQLAKTKNQGVLGQAEVIVKSKNKEQTSKC